MLYDITNIDSELYEEAVIRSFRTTTQDAKIIIQSTIIKSNHY